MMFEGFLSKPGATGSTAITSTKGSIIFMYGTVDGKVFRKSYDNGRSFTEEWTSAMGSFTANNNLIRLKDERLMMTVKRESSDPLTRELGGADFSVVFSSDEGRTWTDDRYVNIENGCFYLMNDRIIRLDTGRILIPLCYHPDEILSKEHFENAGYSGCYYSDDEGLTWNEGKWLKGGNAGGMLAEPMVAQTGDGRVIMYMRTGMGYLYYAESRDGGETFGPAEASSLRSPVAPFTFKRDDFTGLFYAVWDNSFPSPIHQYPRSPICIAVSEDGVNWKFLGELDNNPNHNYGYPSIFFTEDEIIITYYYNETRRFDSKLNRIKLKIFSREELQE